MAIPMATAESHYHPKRSFTSPRLPDSYSPTFPTALSSPTPFFYSNPSKATSTPSLRAFSIKSKASLASLRDLVPSSFSLRGRSRTRQQQKEELEQPKLKDLIYDSDEEDRFLEPQGDSAHIIPIPPMPSKTPRVNTNNNARIANNNGKEKDMIHSEQTTTTATLQRPRSKSRTIIRMLTTKFNPRGSSNAVSHDNQQPQSTAPHKANFRPPPAVANNPYSKEQRDAALRARGLLPPLRPAKDLSTQEMEQDRMIPVVPMPELNGRTSGSSENGPSSEESQAQGKEVTALSAADLIKLEWEKKNASRKMEQNQLERMNTFKFGGSSPRPGRSPSRSSSQRRSMSGEESSSRPPSLPLPPVPGSLNQDQLLPDNAHDLQPYLYPLPPSPAPSSYSKVFSDISSEPPIPGVSSSFASPLAPVEPVTSSLILNDSRLSAFTIPDSQSPSPNSQWQQNQHNLEIDVLASEPLGNLASHLGSNPTSNDLSLPNSGASTSSTLPAPPAISLTPPPAGVHAEGRIVADVPDVVQSEDKDSPIQGIEGVAQSGDGDATPAVQAADTPDDDQRINSNVESTPVDDSGTAGDRIFATVAASPVPVASGGGNASPSTPAANASDADLPHAKIGMRRAEGSSSMLSEDDDKVENRLSAFHMRDDSFALLEDALVVGLPAAVTVTPEEEKSERKEGNRLSIRALPAPPPPVYSESQPTDSTPLANLSPVSTPTSISPSNDMAATVFASTLSPTSHVTPTTPSLSRPASRALQLQLSLELQQQNHALLPVIVTSPFEDDEKGEKKFELNELDVVVEDDEEEFEAEKGVPVLHGVRGGVNGNTNEEGKNDACGDAGKEAETDQGRASNDVNGSTCKTGADDGILIESPPPSPLQSRPALSPVRLAAEATFPVTSSIPPQPQKKTLSLFKRGATISGQHGVGAKDENLDLHPQRRPSMLTNVRKSVIGTFSSGRGNPKRSKTLDVQTLPPSPTLPSSLSPPFNSSTNNPASNGDNMPSIARTLSPTSPTNGHFARSQNQLLLPQRRPSQMHHQGGLSPRQAVSPVMYNRGNILLETAEIEDEETRRMTELAFLG